MYGCVRSTLIALLIAHGVSPGQAGERAAPTEPYVTENGARSSGQGATKGARPGTGTVLDRVAYAVDGAESSHGQISRCGARMIRPGRKDRCK